MDARSRGHQRQSDEVHHDRGYRDAQTGIPPNPGAERHRLTTSPDGLPTELIQVAELTLKAQDVREVLLEVMEDKGVGKASLKVERLCALLNPRRKALGAD